MEGDLDTIGLVAFYEETLACSLPLSTSLSLSPAPPLSFPHSPTHPHTEGRPHGNSQSWQPPASPEESPGSESYPVGPLTLDS